MATYDRLVAMDSTFDLLPQLKDRIAKSSEVTTVINSAVTVSEAKQNTANDAKYETKANVESKTSANTNRIIALENKVTSIQESMETSQPGVVKVFDSQLGALQYERDHPGSKAVWIDFQGVISSPTAPGGSNSSWLSLAFADSARHFYDFGTSGLNDSGTQKLNLKAVGSPTVDSSGVIFTGSTTDYIIAPSGVNFIDVSDPSFSLAFEVTPKSASKGVLMSVYNFALETGGGQKVTANYPFSSGSKSVSSTALLDVNVKQRFVITSSPTELKLYLDSGATFTTSMSVTGFENGKWAGVSFGYMYSSVGNGFNGILHKLAVFDETLTAEKAAKYLAG